MLSTKNEGDEGFLDLGDVFFDRPTVSGCITLRNTTTTPLDFMLVCRLCRRALTPQGSSLTLEDQAEVIYSTSPNTPAIPCANIEILPGRELALYLHVLVHSLPAAVEVVSPPDALRGTSSWKVLKYRQRRKYFIRVF